MSASPEAPARPFRLTVYGPTAAWGKRDRAACVYEGIQTGNHPSGLRWQATASGAVGYALTSSMETYPRWFTAPNGIRFLQSPALFVTDADGGTHAIPLASDRWAVSPDGRFAAFAFGWYDDGSEFREGRGYVDCRVDLWNMASAMQVASTELSAVPERVAFSPTGSVLIDYGYARRDAWEPPSPPRLPTPDEQSLPITGWALAEFAPDPSNGRMPLPGSSVRIPILLPPADAAFLVEGRLLVPGWRGGYNTPHSSAPYWLDDWGRAPIAASPAEWETWMGVETAAFPVCWSPSAACFAIAEGDERRIVACGSGAILHRYGRPYLRAVSNDGQQAVFDVPKAGFCLVSAAGGEAPLKTSGFPKFAFSRAGDRLFVSDDHQSDRRIKGTPARCYDTRTGELLWETAPLPTGYLGCTGGAIWGADDREIFVGLRRGDPGGLLTLGRDGAPTGFLSLGSFLPHLLSAPPGDGILVRAEGLFLRVEPLPG